MFSHLTLNSIFTALLQLQTVLSSYRCSHATFFSLEPGRPWLKPHPRNKWGREFETYPHQDPYHYPLPLLQDLARQAGLRLDLIDDFGHPTQTMGASAGRGGSAGFRRLPFSNGLLTTFKIINPKIYLLKLHFLQVKYSLSSLQIA